MEVYVQCKKLRMKYEDLEIIEVDSLLDLVITCTCMSKLLILLYFTFCYQ